MKKRTIATEAFSFGKRSLFLDFMVAKNNSNYIQITKSEREDDGSYTTRRLAIFMEDFEWLLSGFSSLLHSAAHDGERERTVLDLFNQKKAEDGVKGIKAWDPHLRPREKFLMHGAGEMCDSELIAMLIGSGCASVSAVDLAESILDSVGGDLRMLSGLDQQKLSSFKGIGIGKASAILAALELGRRAFEFRESLRFAKGKRAVGVLNKLTDI